MSNDDQPEHHHKDRTDSPGCDQVETALQEGVRLEDGPFQDLDDCVQERLYSNREVLQTLAELDNALSDDARLALQILREGDQE